MGSGFHLKGMKMNNVKVMLFSQVVVFLIGFYVGNELFMDLSMGAIMSLMSVLFLDSMDKSVKK